MSNDLVTETLPAPSIFSAFATKTWPHNPVTATDIINTQVNQSLGIRLKKEDVITLFII